MYQTIMDTVGRQDPTVFLVGAHRGHDIQFLWNMFPAMTLYAFEPLPGQFAELRKAHGGDRRTTLVNAAMSDHDGESHLYVSNHRMASSLLPFNADCKDCPPDVKHTVSTITARSVRLDSFCMENGIYEVDLLYCDTQGCEGMILDGAGDMPRRGAIRVMFLEMMNTDMYAGSILMDELSRRLMSWSYQKVAAFNEAILPDGRLIHADVLWRRR